MDRIRAGVIGVGFVGAAHIEALRRLPQVEVVAIASSTEERARVKAQTFDISKAYGRALDLIADPEIDVVHNCTPNHLHLPLNEAALLAGKHVLSEKPLAMNGRETAALVEAAARSRAVAAVNFNYRYYPMVQQARAMIQNGDLGEIYLIHGAYLQDWLLFKQDYNWRVDPEQGGEARALGDIGSHWCDLVQHVTGLHFTHVCADVATIHHTRYKPQEEARTFGAGDVRGAVEVPVRTEDYASVLVRFTDSVRGVFTVSQVSAGHKNGLTFEVNGAQGSLRWSQEEPELLWIGRRGRPSEVLQKDPSLLDPGARRYAHFPAGHGEAYPDGIKNLFANVYRYISDRSRVPEFPTFLEAHRTTRVTEAILQSAREGRWIKIEA